MVIFQECQKNLVIYFATDRKKLADFGVEVRVVSAQPGPVVTLYEIEPAVGVKGSQIVAS